MKRRIRKKQVVLLCPEVDLLLVRFSKSKSKSIRADGSNVGLIRWVLAGDSSRTRQAMRFGGSPAGNGVIDGDRDNSNMEGGLHVELVDGEDDTCKERVTNDGVVHIPISHPACYSDVKPYRVIRAPMTIMIMISFLDSEARGSVLLSRCCPAVSQTLTGVDDESVRQSRPFRWAVERHLKVDDHGGCDFVVRHHFM